MRAYLLLSVLAAWTACIVGAALLTGWLAVTGVRALRRGPGRPDSDATAQPSAVFAVLGAYAALMVAAAAVLAGLVLGGSGSRRGAHRVGMGRAAGVGSDRCLEHRSGAVASTVPCARPDGPADAGQVGGSVT